MAGFEKKNIIDEVNKFLEVCYHMVSKTHEPHYVQILYGNLLYKTVFKSADIKYTLFKTDGTPLRVKISCKFESVGIAG